MCGIAGLVTASGEASAAEQRRLDAMLDGIGHRGPDGRASAGRGRALLGATRLAIRAPAGGAQPVVDPASGVLAVCNGEIDNHAELRAWLEARGTPVPGAGDVAVLPGLYAALGPGFVSRLEGPFALALWDPARARLVLARDRVGEKPLFYHAGGGAIRFASEIAPLVRDDPALLQPDPTALLDYLERGCFTGAATPLAELRKLAPGELLELTDEGPVVRRWWRLALPGTPKRRPDAEAFDRVLRRAVERATDVDVEFGIFLSGGLDSSLLAAVCRSVRPERRPPAFVVRFDEDSYDEGDAAAGVARALGLELVPAWLRAEEVPALLRTLVAGAGEPLADPAWLPLARLAERASRDVRTALGGEGADELFGGYPTYLGAQLAGGWLRLPAPVRRGLARGVEAWPASERKVTLGFLLKRFVREAERGGLERHRAWQSSIPPEVRARLGAKGLASRLEEPAPEALLDHLQRYDVEHSLAEALLTKADRGGMRSGLELRAPFLDPGVLAFAATLPRDERVRGLTTKPFLKRYALRHLPRAVVKRRKRGLSVPLAGWLRGPLGTWADRTLAEDRLAGLGIPARATRALLASHGRGEADHARALWTLLVLSEWLAWCERSAS